MCIRDSDYITFIHRGRIVFSSEKDALTEKYGIVRCPKTELESIESSAVVAVRETGFGVEALVEREKVNPALITDNAAIEDIMEMCIRDSHCHVGSAPPYSLIFNCAKRLNHFISYFMCLQYMAAFL